MIQWLLTHYFSCSAVSGRSLLWCYPLTGMADSGSPQLIATLVTPCKTSLAQDIEVKRSIPFNCDDDDNYCFYISVCDALLCYPLSCSALLFSALFCCYFSDLSSVTLHYLSIHSNFSLHYTTRLDSTRLDSTLSLIVPPPKSFFRIVPIEIT